MGSFHFAELISFVPDSLKQILVLLALSFLIGLEREEHSGGQFGIFGGIRTFPIVGFCGFLFNRLAGDQPLVLAAGALALCSFLWLSYRKKIETSPQAGATSEVSGLFTFLLGALIEQNALWEGTTLAVLVLLLLEFKSPLETFAKKISLPEILTFTRFLLIAAVILPIVPNQEFTELQINPFHTWLIVVAISSLSYASYAASRLLGPQRSIWVSALLGGLYSSTSTTVVLAKRSKEESSDQLMAGAIVVASGVMYFRLVALLCIFNWELGLRLAIPFVGMGCLFCVVGGLWMRLRNSSSAVLAPNSTVGVTTTPSQHQNPLALQAAFIFAFLFSLMGILTAVATQYWGTSGIYGLSFLSGLADVDPYVMSLTQSAGNLVNIETAMKGIVIATASNNLVKMVYAALWGSVGVRHQLSLLFPLLTLISLLSLFSI